MAFRHIKVLPRCVSTELDTCPLTTAQLQFYEENGYLVIRRLFDLPTLHIYRQRFVDVCNGKVDRNLLAVVTDRSLRKPGAKPEEYINKIQELLYDDVYSTYSEDPRMLRIVTQLLGEDITAINCMLINKPPGTTVHPPHQDLLFFPFRPVNKILGAWTAIDPVTIDNGCLYVVPKSHKPEELYEHRDELKNIAQYFYGIVNWQEVAPEHMRVDLEMEPGDTVFVSSALVHGSRANRTKTYRKAMSCHYANSGCHYIDVPGTRHEHIAATLEAEVRRRGGDLSFVDLWRIKTKQVRGVRCSL